MNVRPLLLLVIFMLSCASSQAQITITAADMFNETGSYYLAYANHFDPNDPSTSFPCSHLMGAVGGPQLWDFSNGPTNEVSRFDYLAPGGADVAEAFPQATLTEQKSTTFEGQTKTNALYFSQIPGIGRKVFGFYDPEFSSLTPTNVFQPPIVDFPDEIRYLDTWNTTFTLFTTIDVPLLNVSFPAQLNYSSVFTVDAYGTVDLPKLGFGSALRINEAQTIAIAVDLDGTGDYQNIETDYTRNYYWLRPAHGIVAQLNSVQSTAPPPSDFDQATAFLRMFETNHKPVDSGTGIHPVTDLVVSYSKDDGQVLLKWSAPAGTRKFRVEYSGDLSSALPWTALSTLDNQYYLLDASSGTKVKFYRIVSLQ